MEHRLWGDALILVHRVEQCVYDLDRYKLRLVNETRESITVRYSRILINERPVSEGNSGRAVCAFKMDETIIDNFFFVEKPNSRDRTTRTMNGTRVW